MKLKQTESQHADKMNQKIDSRVDINERSAVLKEEQPSRLITVQWRQTDVTREMILLREPTGHIVYAWPLGPY